MARSSPVMDSNVLKTDFKSTYYLAPTSVKQSGKQNLCNLNSPPTLKYSENSSIIPYGNKEIKKWVTSSRLHLCYHIKGVTKHRTTLR